jgi:hypothetical protein
VIGDGHPGDLGWALEKARQPVAEQAGQPEVGVPSEPSNAHDQSSLRSSSGFVIQASPGVGMASFESQRGANELA